LQPSISPDGNGASENGGTEYFVSTYDDFSLENHKLSVWAMTETDTLNAEVGIPGFTTLAVNTENYALPVVASQKPGPIPLGKSMGQPEGTRRAPGQGMPRVWRLSPQLWISPTDFRDHRDLIAGFNEARFGKPTVVLVKSKIALLSSTLDGELFGQRES
jgi:hypothetical protein